MRLYDPFHTLLYYPSFLPPSESWIKTSLLYWDEVSTIVPEENKSEIKGTYLEQLADLGLYSPIDPKETLEHDWRGGEVMVKELERRLSQNDVQRALVNCPDDNSYSISIAKVSGKIANVLAEYKDKRDSNNAMIGAGWIRVKRPAALIYMSLLAERIASDCHVQLSTDSMQFEDSLFYDFDRATDLKAIRIAMEGIVPKLRDDVTYKQIADFKARFHYERHHFQETLSDFQRKLNSAKDETECCFLIEEFRVRIAREIEQLKRILETERLKFEVGSVSSLFTLSQPQVVTTLIGLGIAAPLGPEAAVLSGTLGFVAGGCIKVAERLVANRERRDKSYVPLSYVLNIERELGAN